MAIGGYGRQELAPHSDIDLLLLIDGSKPTAKKWIEKLNTACWDAGLKLALSVRTLEQCREDMRKDLHFLTALLDRRFIAGNKFAFQKLDSVFKEYAATLGGGAFVSAKLSERDTRHKKNGDIRFILQPNVKESKGGLRDIQTLLWITHFLYGVSTPEAMAKKKILLKEEAESLKKSRDFLWQIRCHLHDIAGRADDRLTFEVQPEVAKRLGYDDHAFNVRAEKFMKDYFITANETGYLTRLICAKLEEEHLADGATAGTKKIALHDKAGGFPLVNNRLTFADKDADAIRLFRASQTTGYDIHPDTLRMMRKKNKQAGNYKAFLEILLDPIRATQTLRRMNEAGVLTGLFPEFSNIFAHMQYDLYHAYTADEHTITALGFLHDIEKSSLSPSSRRALYVAMFFHDIAKGTGGTHAEKGAGIVSRYAPLLGLSAEEGETAAWLVEHHLLLTMTAFKRDLNDEKTIQDVANTVQSPERLKLLTFLTTADGMAVGPDGWNNWKSALLEELRVKTYSLLTGDMLLENETPAPQEPIRIIPRPALDHTEVAICVPDRKGLFALLSGAMAAAGASIADARISTLKDGMAFDTFYIQDLSGKFYENIPFLEKTLRNALSGTINLDWEIKQRRKISSKKGGAFNVPIRIIIDNDASNSATMIEVNAKDRPGLLYDITSALTQEGLQISSAKVATFGAQAVDVFYVRDGFGLKILHPDKLASIESAIHFALEKAA